MFILYEHNAISVNGVRYPHDGTRAGLRAAVQQAEQDAARTEAALTERSIRERGHAPTPQELQRGTYSLPETRGPNEIACDRLAAEGSEFNPYTARIAVLKAQRIQSSEMEALTLKEASWTPPAKVEASEDSPYAVAIASMLAAPGFTAEEKSRTQRLVETLRTAEGQWKQEQTREAEAKARAERPEYLNALENARACHRSAELLGTAPQSFVVGSAERLKTLEATGDVEAYWRDTRAAEKALNVWYDQKAEEFKKRHIEVEADKTAALSRLPVEAPPVVEAPKSAIEQALTGGSTTPPAPEANHA